MPSQLSFLLEGEINPVREPAVRKGKETSKLVTSFPGTSRCSDRQGGDRPYGWEWVPLVSRDRGEGLIEAESCGGFRLVAPNPAAGRLASEAAAFPQLCCLPGATVQLVSLETRRDERSEIDNKIQGETSRDDLWFPTEEGKVCGSDRGICRLSLGVHAMVQCVLACSMRRFPVGIQIKRV